MMYLLSLKSELASFDEKLKALTSKLYDNPFAGLAFVSLLMIICLVIINASSKKKR